jgi:hypothetical protein
MQLVEGGAGAWVGSGVPVMIRSFHPSMPGIRAHTSMSSCRLMPHRTREIAIIVFL